jgi:hypothetical protein
VKREEGNGAQKRVGKPKLKSFCESAIDAAGNATQVAIIESQAVTPKYATKSAWLMQAA